MPGPDHGTRRTSGPFFATTEDLSSKWEQLRPRQSCRGRCRSTGRGRTRVARLCRSRPGAIMLIPDSLRVRGQWRIAVAWRFLCCPSTVEVIPERTPALCLAARPPRRSAPREITVAPPTPCRPLRPLVLSSAATTHSPGMAAPVLHLDSRPRRCSARALPRCTCTRAPIDLAQRSEAHRCTRRPALRGTGRIPTCTSNGPPRRRTRRLWPEGWPELPCGPAAVACDRRGNKGAMGRTAAGHGGRGARARAGAAHGRRRVRGALRALVRERGHRGGW